MIMVMVVFVEVPCRERIGELLPRLRSRRVFLVGHEARVELRLPDSRVDTDADHHQFLATIADAEIIRIAVPVGGNFGGQLIIAVWPFAAILSGPPHPRRTMPASATRL